MVPPMWDSMPCCLVLHRKVQHTWGWALLLEPHHVTPATCSWLPRTWLATIS